MGTTYRDLLGLMLSQAKTMGLVDAETGQVDAAEAELAIVNAIMHLADGWDLDAYIRINDNMFITTAGERRYAVPRDFGRLTTPKHKADYNLYLYDGTNEYGIDYVDPVNFFGSRTTTSSLPSTFTVTDNHFMLDPPPDANGTSNYIGRGIYVKRTTSIEWREDILLPNVTALLDGALAQLAMLRNSSQAPLLFKRADRSDLILLTQQARQRMPFRRV